MGFLEVLLLLFIALKIFGIISWSWWMVLIPLYVMVVLYGSIIALQITLWRKAEKDFNDKFKF